MTNTARSHQKVCKLKFLKKYLFLRVSQLAMKHILKASEYICNTEFVGNWKKKKKTQTWQFILQILLNDDVNPKLI